MEWKNCLEVCNRYGETVVNRWIDNLNRAGKNATGDLAKSLEYKVEDNGDEFVVNFYANDYYKFIESGVYPFGKTGPSAKEGWKDRKWPNMGAIKKWCSVKGFSQKAAFPIAMGIRIKGIKPFKFMNIPKQTEDKFERDIEAAFILDIENQISNGI